MFCQHKSSFPYSYCFLQHPPKAEVIALKLIYLKLILMVLTKPPNLLTLQVERWTDTIEAVAQEISARSAIFLEDIRRAIARVTCADLW